VPTSRAISTILVQKFQNMMSLSEIRRIVQRGHSGARSFLREPGIQAAVRQNSWIPGSAHWAGQRPDPAGGPGMTAMLVCTDADEGPAGAAQMDSKADLC
jgi:hypothetical protein